MDDSDDEAMAEEEVTHTSDIEQGKVYMSVITLIQTLCATQHKCQILQTLMTY